MSLLFIIQTKMPLTCQQMCCFNSAEHIFKTVMPHLLRTVSSHVQAEARLAAKRAARAEARDIRMRELERQQKEVRSI